MLSSTGEKIPRKRGGSCFRKPILLKVEKIMNSKRCCNMFKTCRDDSSYKLLCPSFAQSLSSYFIHSTHTFLKRQKWPFKLFALLSSTTSRSFFQKLFLSFLLNKKAFPIYLSTIMISQNVGQNSFAKLWPVTFAKLRHSYFFYLQSVIKILRKHQKYGSIWHKNNQPFPPHITYRQSPQL